MSEQEVQTIMEASHQVELAEIEEDMTVEEMLAEQTDWSE